MPTLLIVADDLSGAAETAGAVAGSTGAAVELRLAPGTGATPVVLAIDTHSRALPARDAGQALTAALSLASTRTLVYKKVDSLLRGNIAAEAAALRDSGAAMLVALAVPRIGRTVRDGIVHLDGTALHFSDLLAHETAPAASSIGEALGLPSVVIPLPVVRSPALDAAVRSALGRGLVPILDGETQDDLDAVAAMLLRLERSAVVLAAGGLARSIGPLLGLEPALPRFTAGAARVVVIAGTRAASAARQVERLAAAGMPQRVLTRGAPVTLDEGDAVVTLDPQDEWDDASLQHALAGVAAAVRALPGRTDLVLTGGDTARRVLDALGVLLLRVESEIEDGAVLSTIDDGAAVVTRPGSFGDEHSLVRILHQLRGTAP